MMSRTSLLRQLVAVTTRMVQGGLSETTRTCGKPICVCHEDSARRHGPNLYLTYRSDGKSRSLYVPPAHADEARAAHTAWERFWEIGCALAALNRDRLRRKWRRADD